MKKNRLKSLMLCLIFVSLVILMCGNVYANETDYDAIIKIAESSNNTTNSTNSTKKDKNPDDSNALLKSLEIEGYDMYPEFNKNTSIYYVSIPTDVKSLEINAETEVESSTLKKSGNTSLIKTENTMYVTVTSKDKTIKRYTIIATKQKDNGLKLTNLSIEGAQLNPEFSETRYYYSTSIEVVKTDTLTPLNIIATANSETAEIEIIGNSNLIEGDNLITIILKDKDDYTTYQVNVSISSKTMVTTVQQSEDDIRNTIYKYMEFAKNKIQEWFADENRKISTIIAGGVVLFIVILLIIINKIKKHKASKKAEKIKRRAK